MVHTNKGSDRFMRKRICSLLIAVVMLLTMLPMAAGASDIVDRGTLYTNENIKWVVYDDGTLYISGYGDVGYWGMAADPPFVDYADIITKIRILGLKDGVVFDTYFLKGCINATKITFNGAVNHMGRMFPESIQEISVPDNNQYFETIDGVLYSKRNKWVENAQNLSYWCGYDQRNVPDCYSLLWYPEGKTDSIYDMPSSVEGIVENAFGAGNKYLESVTLSRKCSKIGRVDDSDQYGFLNYSEFNRLKSVMCPSNESFTSDGSVLYTKDKSEIVWFPDNYRHSHYDIPETVKEVDLATFWNAQNLQSIFIPAKTKITSSYFDPNEDIDFEAEHFELHFEGDAPVGPSIIQFK